MTVFLRLLKEDDKSVSLQRSVRAFRSGAEDDRLFELNASEFQKIPGVPFAYWVSENVRSSFVTFHPMEYGERHARIGPSTGDDDRYVRARWEITRHVRQRGRWVLLNKGGSAAKFYYDYHLVIDWDDARQTFRGFTGRSGRPSERPNGVDHFFREGITWPLRTQSGFNTRIVPPGLIFSHKGPTIFSSSNLDLLPLLALTASQAFGILVSLQVSFGSYEVGAIQKTPVPELVDPHRTALADLAREGWALKRAIDSVEETSHAFVLPAVLLQRRVSAFDCVALEAEVARVQGEIDTISFELYGFSEGDRLATAQATTSQTFENRSVDDEDDSDQQFDTPADDFGSLISWAVGVAFGRFDWRLATGEREIPPEPEPFDPLPSKSPGMLPDGAEPFHPHAGILVDDPGHARDLARLAEEVLERVDLPVPNDVRRWLQRDFFALHLQRYSKSRRKAPIYWPLSTTSGAYTLWIYYPSSSSQTLYTAINDFVEPKLKQVKSDVTVLVSKGSGRSRVDEREFETLQTMELELIEFRDALLEIAQNYCPNQDDGVQITAAPLWQLFRHKPWQKVLKDTWAKLEKGEYDWAHLALSYWPERVREKCRSDKSLAIAHGMEDVFVERVTKARSIRGTAGT